MRLTIKKNHLSQIIFFLILLGCSEKNETWVDQLAANEDVARFMENFEGRGELTDPDSKPTDAKEALKHFSLPDDLTISLVLSEPDIVQPLEINFDHKGRLWVVQYNQYPYPEGLKVTSIDNHTRVTFDKVPQPPPVGVQGADKITFFEDTDRDGTFDKATDAITGLNIATSALLGRGKIWVLNPPYLLAYPDEDDDGLPDGDPEVHAEGFGLEDTHSVVNSLAWGPDGWLYGVQGSTTTANINTRSTKNLRFLGQAIWRYHPDTYEFEIFAEGGGNNPFNLEFDSKGRIFSGSNGAGRGPYYKQGAYYIKSWGKHGPLTNPYAFGFLPNMPLDGDTKRFTHGLIAYEGASLPEKYTGKMFAVNPLHNFIQLTRFEEEGSSFRNIDEEIVLTTNDKWFRPIDIKTGPDGAIYLTDWYDSRLSHIDPRDTWHKSSGRIYRLATPGSQLPLPELDLSTLTTTELIELLRHENKWYRQQSLRLLADRRDQEAIAPLLELLKKERGQLALEALWGIHLSGGISDSVTLMGLSHVNPYVRMWTVRLLGDKKSVSQETGNRLIQLAKKESVPEVRSQLASSAKRLPAPIALPILQGLVSHTQDADDPDNPLLIWWALEQKAGEDKPAVLKLFEDKRFWSNEIVSSTLVQRLAQRWVVSGEESDLAACAELLKLAPGEDSKKLLVKGIAEGLRGADQVSLPDGLRAVLDSFQESLGEAPLTLALRQGSRDAITDALHIIADREADLNLRLAYAELMGEIDQPECVPVLLEIVDRDPSSALKQIALHALAGYDETEIGRKIASIYPNIRADSYVREAALRLFSVRAEWAKAFLDEVEMSRTIHPTDLNQHLTRNFLLLEDKEIEKKIHKHWPESIPLSSNEKTKQINVLKKMLAEGKGDPIAGKSIYQSTCAACHRLRQEGGNIGPELTGYDLRNVDYMLLHTIDPNADIREGFETYKIKTKDGRTLEGTIARREGNAIHLVPVMSGKKTVLTTERITHEEIMQVSAMPERLLQNLSEQEIRDLFAYLSED